MEQNGAARKREYVSWVEVVPRSVGRGWARTFGLRPTLGAFKCLVVAGRLWPLLQGYGMEACPHGFCIARAGAPVAQGGSAGPRECTIPDRAEACSCKCDVPTGNGWCYLDGVPEVDKRVAAAVLGANPQAGELLEYFPEYRAVADWDGSLEAHVTSRGRYALVNLPAEVVVGGWATCRALGRGHLMSEYCKACCVTGAKLPRGEPAAATCSGEAGSCEGKDEAVAQLRLDKREMSNHDSAQDALWVRRGDSDLACAVALPEGSIAPVVACKCPESSVAGDPRVSDMLVAALVGEPASFCGDWYQLVVDTPVSWTTLLRRGEVVYTGNVLARCERPTVVHFQGKGRISVFTKRKWFTVRTHDYVSDTRMRHMRFNVGGFTHAKILEKFEPQHIWKSLTPIHGGFTVGFSEAEIKSMGLGPVYRARCPDAGGTAQFVGKASMYGFAVLAGKNRLTTGPLSLAPEATVWVFAGGERLSSISLSESFDTSTEPENCALVYGMEDDYGIDDGGPSDGESELSAGWVT